MSLLDVKNLDLCFKISGRDYKALHNVSFSLDRAQMLALVGESGNGRVSDYCAGTNLLRHRPLWRTAHSRTDRADG